MKDLRRSAKLRSLILLGCVAAAIAALVACAPKTATDTGTASAPDTTAAAATPEANAAGVVTAESWSAIYPNEYATYMANADNDTDGNDSDPHFAVRGDMLTMYPMIATIWAGSGFTKSYFEPNGHNYSLDDIRASARISEKSLANCLTCKSADFTAMYQAQGAAIMSQPWADVNAQLEEPISCYNCHENDPTTLAVTQAFFANATKSDGDFLGVKTNEALVCGQCHNEYYFNPETKEVTNPYSSLADATPEAMYNFYKTAAAEGKPYVDHTNPNTGTIQLKTQHPEFEFIYGGTMSSMAQRGYSCADCHMGPVSAADDGTQYRSHLLISPLENEELLKTCNITGCHTDLAAEVKAWQAESEAKVMEVGNKLLELNNQMAAVCEDADGDTSTPNTLKADSGFSAEEYAAIQELNREAQWYWDYVMVENSEGAHNPTLSNSTLDKADELVDKALAYF